MMRVRFLTRRCRRWLPCKAAEFHTHHLVFIWPPQWLEKAVSR